jgi:hypothetical protein
MVDVVIVDVDWCVVYAVSVTIGAALKNEIIIVT